MNELKMAKLKDLLCRTCNDYNYTMNTNTRLECYTIVYRLCLDNDPISFEISNALYVLFYDIVYNFCENQKRNLLKLSDDKEILLEFLKANDWFSTIESLMTVIFQFLERYYIKETKRTYLLTTANNLFQSTYLDKVSEIVGNIFLRNIVLLRNRKETLVNEEKLRIILDILLYNKTEGDTFYEMYLEKQIKKQLRVYYFEFRNKLVLNKTSTLKFCKDIKIAYEVEKQLLISIFPKFLYVQYINILNQELLFPYVDLILNDKESGFIQLIRKNNLKEARIIFSIFKNYKLTKRKMLCLWQKYIKSVVSTFLEKEFLFNNLCLLRSKLISIASISFTSEFQLEIDKIIIKYCYLRINKIVIKSIVKYIDGYILGNIDIKFNNLDWIFYLIPDTEDDMNIFLDTYFHYFKNRMLNYDNKKSSFQDYIELETNIFQIMKKLIKSITSNVFDKMKRILNEVQSPDSYIDMFDEDISIKIYEKHAWNIPTQTLVLHNDLQKIYNKVEFWYKIKYNNSRKLSWCYNHSRVNLKANFKTSIFFVECTSLQANILLFLQDLHESTIKNIENILQIKDCKKQINKMIINDKHQNNILYLTDNHMLKINTSFKPDIPYLKVDKVSINNYKNKEIRQSCLLEDKHILESKIISFLKHDSKGKTRYQINLYFKSFNKELIDSCLDSLIEREYIEKSLVRYKYKN